MCKRHFKNGGQAIIPQQEASRILRFGSIKDYLWIFYDATIYPIMVLMLAIVVSVFMIIVCYEKSKAAIAAAAM